MPVHLQDDARHAVLRGAEAQARSSGSPTIEAEHLLLALAAEGPVGRLLAEYGIDVQGIHEALARELERSLAAVGVELADHPLPRAPTAPRRRPKLATSSRQALVRAVGLARGRDERRITAPHLLCGVLQAELGTVPRALDLARVDRAALRASAERLLETTVL